MEDPRGMGDGESGESGDGSRVEAWSFAVLFYGLAALCGILTLSHYLGGSLD